jgi:hypothetical protein
MKARSGRPRPRASTLSRSENPVKKLPFNMQNDGGTSHTQPQVSYEGSERQHSQHTLQDREQSMTSEIHSPSESTPMQTSPFAGSTCISNSDMIQGVVVTETGRFPRKSKYTGMSSGQVLAKSAEELFKHQVGHIDVMKFFCPLMSFAEEIPITPTYSCSLVDKATADICVNSE